MWGVWLDDAVCFGTDRDSEIAIHLESGDDVVIMYGIAEAPADGAVPDAFVSAYDAKYSIKLDTSDDATALLEFRPLKILARRESDFQNTATRWHL